MDLCLLWIVCVLFFLAARSLDRREVVGMATPHRGALYLSTTVMKKEQWGGAGWNGEWMDGRMAEKPSTTY